MTVMLYRLYYSNNQTTLTCVGLTTFYNNNESMTNHVHSNKPTKAKIEIRK